MKYSKAIYNVRFKKKNRTKIYEFKNKTILKNL